MRFFFFKSVIYAFIEGNPRLVVWYYIKCSLETYIYNKLNEVSTIFAYARQINTIEAHISFPPSILFVIVSL